MMGIAGLNRKHDHVLVIRDADVVSSVLREALAQASPEERPGLEHAVALVESAAGATEAKLRADWTRARLAAVGFTGDLSSVAAIKALRQAEPGLSLLAAVQLQKEALTQPE
ncbi:hypothetical protein ACPCBC_20550 [Streptomyces incarnatus]|uniref:hypothetical protein n=1 Tax=unclassified Streptomyces TaxID=2593676 RepID=UPI0011A8D309|nr:MULTISPECIES: hypothetical protein [Streptomyces]QHC32899.1 hypothetical protein GR129_33115 [Streptomyces sp. HF10]WKE73380.1 hypothetical protein QHG49_32435 [Streptomyces sp. WP-1]